MIWITLGVMFASLGLVSLALMARPRASFADQITYAIVCIAAMFLTLQSLIAFIRAA